MTTLQAYKIYNNAYIYKVGCYNLDSTGTLCKFIGYKNQRVLFIHCYTNASWLIIKSKVTEISNCGVKTTIGNRVHPPNLISVNGGVIIGEVVLAKQQSTLPFITIIRNH